MGKHKLEDYFKNRLSQQEEHIDKDLLWAGLGLEDEQEKKKPIWMFWLLGLFFALVLATLILYADNSVDEQALIVENESTEQLDLNESMEQGFIDETNIADSVEDNPITESINVHSSQIIKSQANTTVQNKKLEEVKNDDNNAFSQDNKVVSIAVNISKTNINSGEGENGFLPNDEAIDQEELPLRTVKQDNINYTQGQNNNSGAVAQNNVNKEFIEENRMLLSVDNLATIGLSTFNQSKDPLRISNESLIQPIDEQRNRWSIGSYAILYKTTRTLIGTDKNQEYINARNNTERSLETFVAGGFLEYKVTRHNYLRLGIEHQSISERFDFSTEADSSYLKNLIAYDATVYRKWLNYNRHQLINIPITLGFNTDREKWNFMAEITPVLTIKKSFDGTFLQEESNIPENTNQFSTDFSVAGRLALGLSYQYDDHWSLSFMPSFQQHFKSFSREDAGYEQKYTMIGVQLGLKYGF